MGHHRVSKLPRQKQKNPDVIIDTMLKSIWESLDGIIDFTDDGMESDEDERPAARIGFQADLVADTMLTPDEEFEDEDEDSLTLHELHRVHKDTKGK